MQCIVDITENTICYGTLHKNSSNDKNRPVNGKWAKCGRSYTGLGRSKNSKRLPLEMLRSLVGNCTKHIAPMKDENLIWDLCKKSLPDVGSFIGARTERCRSVQAIDFARGKPARRQTGSDTPAILGGQASRPSAFQKEKPVQKWTGLNFVQAERLELSHLAALDPKSSVSTNSTTPAYFPIYRFASLISFNN